MEVNDTMWLKSLNKALNKENTRLKKVETILSLENKRRGSIDKKRLMQKVKREA
jgi:hypothetical protein